MAHDPATLPPSPHHMNMHRRTPHAKVPLHSKHASSSRTACHERFSKNEFAAPFLAVVFASFSLCPSALAADNSLAGPSHALIQDTCFDCHNSETSEAGLNLEELSGNMTETEIRERWILVHDRVNKGEMPPDAESLAEADRKTLLNNLSDLIYEADISEVQRSGRGTIRRLTRQEYEQNLRQLLQLPHLDIRSILPADREKFGCNKVADALDVSRVQIAAYLNAADVAIRTAIASGIAPRPAVEHRLPATRMFATANTFGEREAMFYAKDSRLVKLSFADLTKLRKANDHDPAMELAIFRSASWPYYGYPDSFVAREAGNYHIRFSARSVRQIRDFRLRPGRKSVAMTFRARKRSGADVSGDVRATGGIMDIQPEVGVYETVIRLKKNETFEYSLLGLPVPRAINPPDGQLYYDFPPMPEGGHPGIAFQWLELRGPIDPEAWPPSSHKVLFDDLPIRAATTGSVPVELLSETPHKDASRLLRRFLHLASRKPLPEAVVVVYEELVLNELKNGESLAEALIAGYSAFLCSGDFIFLQEPTSSKNAPTADHDSPQTIHNIIASRLSHFLTNRSPDETLSACAKDKKLLDTKVLKQEANRAIQGDGFENFVTNFTDYWLSLKDIRRDEPDVRLYPEYRFDDYLIDSMASETRTYFNAMVKENLPIAMLVDSDFVFVNDRLARHYDLPAIEGSELRRITLPEWSPYGGLITQGAIMKVTANGTTTSPVLRGAWIMEHIMGDPPPPPPPGVPAVEPDIRGATTIREQLALHTKDTACASCHARFDPVGFALENFDIMGAWRDRYRSLGTGELVTGIDLAGHNFSYRVAESIDASGKVLDGREFQEIKSLKAILLTESRQLARNFLHQLTVYSTGTPVRFSDRPIIEDILHHCEPNNYRTQDLLHRLIQSPIFLGVKITHTEDTSSKSTDAGGK